MFNCFCASQIGSHLNLMEFIGISMIKGKLCTVMKLYENGSLDALHHTYDFVTPVHFFKLLHDVSKGCAHLHSLGIVHRDIRCANVLIGGDLARGAQKGGFQAVLGDWGLARKVDKGNSTSREVDDATFGAEVGTQSVKSSDEGLEYKSSWNSESGMSRTVKSLSEADAIFTRHQKLKKSKSIHPRLRPGPIDRKHESGSLGSRSDDSSDVDTPYAKPLQRHKKTLGPYAQLEMKADDLSDNSEPEWQRYFVEAATFLVRFVMYFLAIFNSISFFIFSKGGWTRRCFVTTDQHALRCQTFEKLAPQLFAKPATQYGQTLK